MIFSAHNKPARNDKEMKADERDRKRRERMKQKTFANKLAHQIFVSVLKAIEEGKKNFTKEEMIQLTRGEGRLTQDERYIWHKACNQAIYKVRAYYWSGEDFSTDKKMFNFVRDTEEYCIVDYDDKLNTNVIFEAYDRKMKGIEIKQREIAESLYGKVLTLNKKERIKLIDQIKLINGETQ